MLYVVSSSDHVFNLLFAFLNQLEISLGVCGHCVQQCQIPVDSSSTLLQYSGLQKLPVLECSISIRCL